MDLNEIKKKVFVSCPFDLLQARYLPRILKEGINPEIGLNGTILEDFMLKDFMEVARVLGDEGLRCTVHAPFTDISPGAIDRKVGQISVDRIRSAIDISVVLGARSMVFHTGWERKIYADATDAWLANFSENLERILTHARHSGIPIMLENVFELDTLLHKEIFRRFPDKTLGFCLDAGHVYAFSKTPLARWIEDLGVRIGHLHLHDNHGHDDEHLAPGSGVVDFDLLFSWLAEKQMAPIMTFEAHDEETVVPGLLAIGQLLEKYPVVPGGG